MPCDATVNRQWVFWWGEQPEVFDGRNDTDDNEADGGGGDMPLPILLLGQWDLSQMLSLNVRWLLSARNPSPVLGQRDGFN